MSATDERTAWVKWLRTFGADNFYDAFMRTAQNAESTCTQCHELIYLDVREGGGVPDWRTNDGDYGCDQSPDSDDDGVGSHAPRRHA